MKMLKINFLAIIILLLYSVHGRSQQLITTVAGTNTVGYSGDGGPATSAQINKPEGIAVDTAGNLYIPDQMNHRIRKVDVTTGIITTIAGTGVIGYSGDGGPATAALLNDPKRIAVDSSGNLLIAEYTNRVIRKITPTGIISTFAGNGTTGYSGDGGPATMAQLSGPCGIAIDANGNAYISDVHRIRKVDAAGIITTIAGTGASGFSGDGGPATAAQINRPQEIVADTAGNIFLADTYNNRIRKINSVGIITTVAGTGTAGYSGDGGLATAAQLNSPQGLTMDAAGNLYVADFYNERIRKIDVTGTISTIAGTGIGGFSGDGGLATTAQIQHPTGVATSGNNIFLTDVLFNHRIRKIFPDHLPYFEAGDTVHLAVCIEIITIDTLLKVTDSDAAQTITWHVETPPAHGVLSASYTATSTGGTLLPSPTSYSPTAGYMGLDTFKVSVSDGFAADTITVYLKVGCNDAVEEVNANSSGLRVYPNPANGRFTVYLASAITQKASMTVSDAMGRTLKKMEVNTNEAATMGIDIPGLYFLRCLMQNGEVFSKNLILMSNE